MEGQLFRLPFGLGVRLFSVFLHAVYGGIGAAAQHSGEEAVVFVHAGGPAAAGAVCFPSEAAGGLAALLFEGGNLVSGDADEFAAGLAAERSAAFLRQGFFQCASAGGGIQYASCAVYAFFQCLLGAVVAFAFQAA